MLQNNSIYERLKELSMSSGEDNTAAQRLLQELESSFLNKSAIDRAREEEQIMQKYGVSVIASTASSFIDEKH